MQSLSIVLFVFDSTSYSFISISFSAAGILACLKTATSKKELAIAVERLGGAFYEDIGVAEEL